MHFPNSAGIEDSLSWKLEDDYHNQEIGRHSFKRALSSVPSSLIQSLILGELDALNLDVIIQFGIVSRQVSDEE